MLERKERQLMLMALVLLAAIDAVPSPTISLTLTGETDRPPVSAAPRSLSDFARELREGRKAVGGFSAAESTVPQSRNVYIPVFEPEPETNGLEPEVVTEVQPVYVPTYIPVWYGGSPRNGRLRQRTAARLGAPRPMSHSLTRPFGAPPFQPRHTTVGLFRQR